MADKSPTDGLILFWDMFTVRSGKIDDLTSTGNDGTITGTADRAGQVGRARNFDGSDDKIVLDSAPSTSSFTITAWLKPLDVGGTDGAIGLLDSASYVGYVAAATNKFRAVSALSSAVYTLDTSSTDATGTYAHIAYRYNGHTFYLFRNGVTQASVAASGTYTWSDVRVGTAGAANFWRGGIDEVRFYNRALSLAEIAVIYNDTVVYSPTSDPTHILYYLLRQNVGATYASTLFSTGWYNSASNKPFVTVTRASRTDMSFGVGDTYRKYEDLINVDTWVPDNSPASAFFNASGYKNSLTLLDAEVKRIINAGRFTLGPDLWHVQIVRSVPLDEVEDARRIFRTRHTVRVLWGEDIS